MEDEIKKFRALADKLDELREKAREPWKTIYGILHGAVIQTLIMLSSKPTCLRQMIAQIEELNANLALISNLQTVVYNKHPDVAKQLDELVQLIYDRRKELWDFLV